MHYLLGLLLAGVVHAAPLAPYQTLGTLVAGQINQQDVIWRIDTGASEVVISQALADQLALVVRPKQGRVAHAQGQVWAGSAWVNDLVLGPWRIPALQVWVLPGDSPHQPLWGLAGLEDLVLTLDGQQMTLEPRVGSGIMPHL